MIIGVDPSLSETGIWYNREGCIGVGVVIKTNVKESRGKRLLRIAREFDVIVKHLIGSKEIEGLEFYIEEVPFAAPHSRSISVMSEVHGILKMMLARYVDVKVYFVHSASWKKEVLGFGRLDKKEVRKRAEKLSRLKFENQNLCDAWCIWKYGQKKKV
jgi:Holliday junction resolvasome RuvABC endonuclease subunit